MRRNFHLSDLILVSIEVFWFSFQEKISYCFFIFFHCSMTGTSRREWVTLYCLFIDWVVLIIIESHSLTVFIYPIYSSIDPKRESRISPIHYKHKGIFINAIEWWFHIIKTEPIITISFYVSIAKIPKADRIITFWVWFRNIIFFFKNTLIFQPPVDFTFISKRKVIN